MTHFTYGMQMVQYSCCSTHGKTLKEKFDNFKILYTKQLYKVGKYRNCEFSFEYIRFHFVGDFKAKFTYFSLFRSKDLDKINRKKPKIPFFSRFQKSLVDWMIHLCPTWIWKNVHFEIQTVLCISLSTFSNISCKDMLNFVIFVIYKKYDSL